MAEACDQPETLVRDLVRATLGSDCAVQIRQWHVQQPGYRVVAIATSRPPRRLVAKLEWPDSASRDHRFDSVAAIARLVQAHTDLPTFDVLAVDTTRSTWPCNILLVTEIAGSTWAQLYPTLSPEQQHSVRRQIGRAAAQLHEVRCTAFGAIQADGSVIDCGAAAQALSLRVSQRIRAPARRDLMLEVIERHHAAFARVPGPCLVHEDLNPNNLLLAMRDEQPVLTGVLDFEAAWAGVACSDLARLELWRLTRGAAVRDGYAEITSLPEEYAAGRPILQLLWCLEYADAHHSTVHQADTDRVCSELGLPPIDVLHG
jgi:aminoglycoside phosphotransferase (APT) family kinase protein